MLVYAAGVGSRELRYKIFNLNGCSVSWHMYFLGAFIATYVDIFSLHIAQGYSINPQNQFCIFAELFAIYECRRIQRQSEIRCFLCHSSNTRYIFHLPMDARHDCVITFDHVALEFSLWHQPQIPCSSLTEKGSNAFSRRKNP